MRNAIVATLVVALATAATQAAASSVNRYTSLWIFGDSLSDPGNLHAATGGAIPQSPPYDRRFSDGPVWAEHVAADFDREGLPNGNFAFGDAAAVPVAGPRPIPVPDLPDQIAAFRATANGRLGTRPVATLWIGANDFFSQAEADPTPQAVAARMVAAANAVTAGVTDLAASGIDSFLVFNMPPLELTPAFGLRGPEASALAAFATRTYNDTLAAGLDTLAATGIDIGRFDIETAMRELIAEPESLGLQNVTLPCYVQSSPPETRCSDAFAAVSFFFDTVHPTRIVHAEIANRVRSQIAPVPVPAAGMLLVAAIGMLGLARRRRDGASRA